jgi:HEAT repeat protein
LVKNQYDFSKLCGRTAAWFSCLKTRNQPFTPAAALTLSLSLRMRANEILEEQQYKRAIELSELLLDGTYDSIRKKQAAHLACPQ